MESDVPFKVRIPFILGVNTDEENIRATCEFIKDAPNLKGIELLPYNEMAGAKYRLVGKTYDYDFKKPSEDVICAARNIIESYGIKILSGTSDTIELNGQIITICGIDDPDVVQYTANGVHYKKQLEALQETLDAEAFNILLSHRPELADEYQNYEFDVVLSGHAHGGQWILPGVLNGLYAPHQGLFPKYAGGRYEFAGQTFIVSRGLARESTLAPRIFNRPELVIVEVAP
jgi:predicted MPP superfamily phosphohydrolase